MGSIFFPLIEAHSETWFPLHWNIPYRSKVGSAYCVTEFKTVFRGPSHHGQILAILVFTVNSAK